MRLVIGCFSYRAVFVTCPPPRCSQLRQIGYAGSFEPLVESLGKAIIVKTLPEASSAFS
jgi:hypothetical protein